MTERNSGNGLLNDGDSLAFENMIKDWDEAQKFDTDGYGDLAFALISNFYNRLALIKDQKLVNAINAIIKPKSSPK